LSHLDLIGLSHTQASTVTLILSTASLMSMAAVSFMTA
jgi:hypothetical protein